MSEMQDFGANQSQEIQNHENMFEYMSVFPNQEGKKANMAHQVVEALNSSRSVLGDPQIHLVDPDAVLPLNSEILAGAHIENIMGELNHCIQNELDKIHIVQRKISFWEQRVEKNKSLIATNRNAIQNNISAIAFSKKNRDYWLVRSESVLVDYSNAAATNRPEDWAWLIKKYGLKNLDGSPLHSDNLGVDKICENGANNLAGEYKNAGTKFEQERRDREAENSQLIRENGRLKDSNETLQNHISVTYAGDVTPLQDGVLLFKEFGVKLKSLAQDQKSSFGDLRSWAEVFLNEFLKSNPRVHQGVVTEFRKLASIPLPAEYC